MTHQHDPDAAAQLAATKAELAAVVRTLCDRARLPVLRDGRTTALTAPSRLAQLREAVSTTRNGGRGGGGAPSPVNEGAVDVLTHIEAVARTLHRSVLDRTHLTVEQHLRAVVDLVDQWRSADQARGVRDAVGRLLAEVDAQLDPPDSSVGLAELCPACDHRMAWRWDPTIAESVQVDALVISKCDGMVTCRACASRWHVVDAWPLIHAVHAWRAECRRIAAWRFVSMLRHLQRAAEVAAWRKWAARQVPPS